jgi:hypothetical protein
LPHWIYFPWTRVDGTPHPTADDGARDLASICVAAAIISRRRMCWPGLLPFWLQWWQQGDKVGRGQHKKKVTITCCIFFLINVFSVQLVLQLELFFWGLLYKSCNFASSYRWVWINRGCTIGAPRDPFIICNWIT